MILLLLRQIYEYKLSEHHGTIVIYSAIIPIRAGNYTRCFIFIQKYKIVLDFDQCFTVYIDSTHNHIAAHMQCRWSEVEPQDKINHVQRNLTHDALIHFWLDTNPTLQLITNQNQNPSCIEYIWWYLNI